MKKSVKRIMITVIMLTLILCGSITTQAKVKKLKVNTVYTTAKKIKGTTKLKKAKVVAKIGKKTYKAKSNSKGKFIIKIKKQKKGTKVKVTVYKGKKKYAKKTVKVKTIPWYQKKPFKGHKAAIAGNSGISNKKVFNQYDNSFLVYCKKGYYVKFTIAGEKNCVSTKVYKKTALANVYTKTVVGTKRVTLKIYRNKDDKLIDSYSITPQKVKLPKTDKIDYEQFLRDYDKVQKTGKEIDRSIGDYYRYQILYNPVKGSYVSINSGKKAYIYSPVGNGTYVEYTALNGATLYYTIGTKGTFNFDMPTLTKYDGVIKPGETKKFEGIDFKEGELINDDLFIKVHAYKDGKIVGIAHTTEYLIQGYADWMFK